MTDKVLIVGAGAIGAFYGSLLAKAGAEVCVISHAYATPIAEQGFDIQSHTLGHWQFQPKAVFKNGSDYPYQADYLLVCTKINPTVNRVALIRDAISPQTAIVLIQNGVEIEAEIQQAFPNHELISGLAFICCQRIPPRHIQHLAYGKLTLGNFPGCVTPATRHLQTLFLRAGIECDVSGTITTSRWQKCVWNAAFNPLSVLSGGLPTLDILKNQESLIRKIMQEVCDVATSSGHTLPADLIHNHIQHTYSMPPYKTSMLLDFERGQPMEIEAILGNTLRVAKRHGVVCPMLETLYALMQLIALSTHPANHETPTCN